MPTRALPMKKIRDLIRPQVLRPAYLSHEQIFFARALAVSKGVVAKYVARVDARGLDPTTLLRLPEDEVKRLGDCSRRQRGNRSTADGRPRITPSSTTASPLKRPGVTLRRCSGRSTRRRTPGSRSTATRSSPSATARVRRDAAPLDAPDPRRRREAVRRLRRRHGAFSWARRRARPDLRRRARRIQLHSFACATPRQTLDDWVDALVRALEYVDGVPGLIVPDNARALIADPDRYEPRAFGHDLGSGEPLRHGGAAGPAISTRATRRRSRSPCRSSSAGSSHDCATAASTRSPPWMARSSICSRT